MMLTALTIGSREASCAVTEEAVAIDNAATTIGTWVVETWITYLTVATTESI
jgi:hypothetical protein